MIPKAITPALIQSSPAIFRDLCLYINETKNRIDGSAPAGYPSGLKQLLLLVNLDNAVHGGGLWGYFGDITNDDGTVAEIDDVIRFLNHMQAGRIGGILEEALEVWKEFLAVYLPARCRVNKKSFEEFQLSRTARDTMESQLDPLDEEYYLAREELAQRVGAYVREHAEEFVHPSLN